MSNQKGISFSKSAVYEQQYPSVDAGFLKEGLTIAAEAMAEFGNGTTEDMIVY